MRLNQVFFFKYVKTSANCNLKCVRISFEIIVFDDSLYTWFVETFSDVDFWIYKKKIWIVKNIKDIYFSRKSVGRRFDLSMRTIISVSAKIALRKSKRKKLYLFANWINYYRLVLFFYFYYFGPSFTRIGAYVWNNELSF